MHIASSAPWPRFIAYDKNGQPLVGGKVYVFYAGTTTAVETVNHHFNPNPHPVILDAGGQADIWIDEGETQYRILVYSADDQLIYSADNIRQTFGAEGPQEGPPGPIGEEGAQGLPGPDGPTGYTGVIGDTGADAQYGAGEVFFREAATYTYTVPTGASGFLITLIGAGGGGGGGQPAGASTTCPKGGDGGNAGGHGEIIYQRAHPVAPGDVIKVTVGAGGTGGAANASGNDGGDTYIKVNDVEILRAEGGVGGGTAQLQYAGYGAQYGGIGYYNVFCKAGSGDVIADQSVPMQILSLPGRGGDAATGPCGQGGRGGRAGMAPCEPVTAYSGALLNGGDAEHATGNGSGGGGGGGGACYAYGVGVESILDEIPEYTRSYGGTQLPASSMVPIAGQGGKGGNGHDGICLIKFQLEP